VNPPHRQRPLGNVPLFLADATKSVEMAPNGIAIGLIQLRGWQVHRLFPLPLDLAKNAAYLVRVNYDFDIIPDVPAPTWAEVEFEFPPSDVMVVDAIPRGVTRSADASPYELTEQLNFLHRNSGAGSWWPIGSPAANIAMPAVVPQIDCFGIGGARIGWRHSKTVPAGTQTGCFVLIVPTHYEQLSVVADGKYHVETDPDLRLRPAGRRDAFDVRLPVAVPERPSAPTFLDTDSVPCNDGPRVFVSYANESTSHKDAVEKLCRLLEDHGVDVRVDQQNLDSRRNWDEWTNTQILRSDYVIVIASPAYRAAGDGTLPKERHLGVRSEYQRLADLLHRYRDEWMKKLLPVVLPGRSVDEIPLTFLPGTGDYYRVESFTPDGAASLFQVLLRDRMNV
jgi:hypothetical protein